MAKKKQTDEGVVVSDHVDDAFKAELDARAAGTYPPAEPLGVAAPGEPHAEAEGSDGGNGVSTAKKKVNRMRLIGRPRSTYQVIGVKKKTGARVFLADCKSKRRAEYWCEDNASVIDQLCDEVIIQRAREVSRH